MKCALSYALCLFQWKSDHDIKFNWSPMIFISGVISIVFQKNTLCKNKIRVIYFCRNCVNFCHNGLFIDFFGGDDCPSPCCHPISCTYVQVNKGLQWVHVKEAIPPYLGIFTYILALSSIFWHSAITNHINELVSYIQIYSEPCVTVYFMKWIPWFFLIPPGNRT